MWTAFCLIIAILLISLYATFGITAVVGIVWVAGITVIQKMKKLPILINMARGEIVNTDDLLIALKNGDLRGAALDVTNPEPISGYHELCSLKNCIIVPHIGTATSECRIDMARIAAENICNHYELG